MPLSANVRMWRWADESARPVPHEDREHSDYAWSETADDVSGAIRQGCYDT